MRARRGKSIAAAFGLVLVLAFHIHPAAAQVQSPGLFASLTGSFVFPAFEDWRQFDTPFATSSRAGVGSGFGGAIHGGYRFYGGWDFALGGEYQRTGYGGKSVDIVNNQGRERYRGWLLDAELGYNFTANGIGMRAFAGLRYLKSRFEVANPMPPLPTQRVDVDYSGIGPRLGIDLAYRFRGTGFVLFGSLSGAALFGSLEERAITLWSCADCKRSNAAALNFDAQIGLAYLLGPRFSLALGWRFDGWWGNNFAVLDKSGGGDGSGRAGIVNHGPFARIAYNFGMPGRK